MSFLGEALAVVRNNSLFLDGFTSACVAVHDVNDWGPAAQSDPLGLAYVLGGSS